MHSSTKYGSEKANAIRINSFGIGAGRQLLEQGQGVVRIFGMEPQLGGAMPVVRFVANPSGNWQNARREGPLIVIC